ncbi:response regulator [candidate division KSB1 bacterium]|nr:response regulator [candidate division KSB1 bacterium]NIR70923.1 response regulator [candidate division KSB1 bacterium]NIS23095.1 response regulator [candidate division KSB1 bacterium]NIT69930.1 response regulator [candidate division KSB1 bacterium]NIU23596.1 response regulator [candidate division KSB1 bacterium]
MVQKSVLIVDDEEDITWGISRSLAKTYDLKIHCVHSGDEASKALKKTKFDLVVSDIHMPGRSGLQLLLDIRKNYPGTKIIMMTAYVSQEIKQQIESRGGFFYIEKPFDIGYLREIILEALETDDNGFNGYIDRSGIRELLEFSCARKRDFSLLLAGNGEQGTICFKNGDIIHAECGDLIGERALFNILNWGSGTFKIEPRLIKKDRTILRDWKTLLH